MTKLELTKVGDIYLPSAYLEGKMPYRKAALILKTLEADDEQFSALRSIETDRVLTDLYSDEDILKGWVSELDGVITEGKDFNPTLNAAIKEHSGQSSFTLDNGRTFSYTPDAPTAQQTTPALSTVDDKRARRGVKPPAIDPAEKSKKISSKNMGEIPLKLEGDTVSQDIIKVKVDTEGGVRGLVHKIIALAAAFNDENAVKSLVEMVKKAEHGSSIDIRLPENLHGQRDFIINKIMKSKGVSLTDTLESIVREASFSRDVKESLKEATRFALSELASTYQGKTQLAVTSAFLKEMNFIGALSSAGKSAEYVLEHFPLLADHLILEKDEDSGIEVMTGIREDTPVTSFLHVSALMSVSTSDFKELLTDIAKGLNRSSIADFYRAAEKPYKGTNRYPTDMVTDTIAKAIISDMGPNQPHSQIPNPKTGELVPFNEKNLASLLRHAKTVDELTIAKTYIDHYDTKQELDDKPQSANYKKFIAAYNDAYRTAVQNSKLTTDEKKAVDFNKVYMVNSIITLATSAHLETASIQNVGLGIILGGLSEAGFSPSEITEVGKITALGKASPFVLNSEGQTVLRYHDNNGNPQQILCTPANKDKVRDALKSIEKNGLHSAEAVVNTLIAQYDDRLQGVEIEAVTHSDIDDTVKDVDSPDNTIRKVDSAISDVISPIANLIQAAKLTDGPDKGRYKKESLNNVLDTSLSAENIKAIAGKFGLDVHNSITSGNVLPENAALAQTYATTMAEKCLTDLREALTSSIKAQDTVVLSQVVGLHLEAMSDVSLLAQKILTLPSGSVITSAPRSEDGKQDPEGTLRIGTLEEGEFDSLHLQQSADKGEQRNKLIGTLFTITHKGSSDGLSRDRPDETEEIFIGKEDRNNGSVDSFMLSARNIDGKRQLTVTPSETKIYQNQRTVAHYNAPDQFAMMLTRIASRYQKLIVHNTMNKSYQTDEGRSDLAHTASMKVGYNPSDTAAEFSGENGAILTGSTGFATKKGKGIFREKEKGK